MLHELGVRFHQIAPLNYAYTHTHTLSLYLSLSLSLSLCLSLSLSLSHSLCLSLSLSSFELLSPHTGSEPVLPTHNGTATKGGIQECRLVHQHTLHSVNKPFATFNCLLDRSVNQWNHPLTIHISTQRVDSLEKLFVFIFKGSLSFCD